MADYLEVEVDIRSVRARERCGDTRPFGADVRWEAWESTGRRKRGPGCATDGQREARAESSK